MEAFEPAALPSTEKVLEDDASRLPALLYDPLPESEAFELFDEDALVESESSALFENEADVESEAFLLALRSRDES